jgi:hypothetical protein
MTSEENDRDQSEKLKVIYDLAKSHYNDETDRYRRLDEKAAKLFSFLALMTGAFGFFGKWLLDTIGYPNICQEWGLFLIGLSVALALITSGVFILQALWLHRFDQPFSHLSAFEELNKKSLKSVYTALATSYLTALEAKRNETDRKASLLIRASYTTTAAVILFVILVALFTWHTLNSKIQNRVDRHPHHQYSSHALP